MKSIVLKKLTGLNFAGGSTVVALGNFDGVHRGHRKIISVAVAEAAKNGKKSVIVTFKDHTRKLVKNGAAELKKITPLKVKREIISGLGADFILELDFTSSISAMSPEQFTKKVLVDKLGVWRLVAGEDFRFGHGKKGNLGFLRAQGKIYGFGVKPVRAMKEAGQKISSSLLRELIAGGDFGKAHRLMGREFSVTGPVVRGKGIGRAMGLPTANVLVPADVLLPCGVFKVRAEVGGKAYGGVANSGKSPTFDRKAGRCRLEVHLLGFRGDVYGKEITVTFEKKIRKEKKFADALSLKSQICRDISFAEGAG